MKSAYDEFSSAADSFFKFIATCIAVFVFATVWVYFGTGGTDSWELRWLRKHSTEINGVYYHENKDGIVSVVGAVEEPPSKITIEATVNGKAVSAIADEAFKYDSGIYEIVIPNTVTYIGKDAFCYCHSLRSINIPTGVTIIPEKCFAHTDIKNIAIPEGVTEIGASAFERTGVNFIAIPSSVTTIGEKAFADTKELEYVFFDAGLESIEPYAFSGTSKLEKVFLPDTLTYLGSYAFEYSGLTEVWMPENMDSFHTDCFSWANSLEKIYMSEDCDIIESESTPKLSAEIIYY